MGKVSTVLAKDQLLITLMESCNCLYLSDLYTVNYRGEVIEFLEKTKACDYSASQWSEAFHYILREETTEINPEKLRKLLLEKL